MLLTRKKLSNPRTTWKQLYDGKIIMSWESIKHLNIAKILVASLLRFFLNGVLKQ